MKLLFTKNTTVLSRLIRWGFNDPCSHFAIELYRGQIVFQSNLYGCDFQAAKTFKSWQTIVHEIDYPMEQAEEDKIFDGVVEQMVGNGYDFKALAYFAIRGIMHKFFWVPMPDKNAWASKDLDLCVEAANALPDAIIPKEIKMKDLSMKRPEELYHMIMDAKVFK